MKALSVEMFSGRTFALHADVIIGSDGERLDAVLAVNQGKIVSIGSPKEILQKHPDLPIHRLKDCAIVPGFVDAHHHILDPFAKSITFGEPAQIWRRVWMPLEATATVEDCYIGAKWSFLEAMRGGVTCIVDHSLRSEVMIEAANRAAEETGIRLVSSVGAYDRADIDSPAGQSVVQASIDQVLQMADRHRSNCKKHTHVYPSIACGNVQTNSVEMIAEVARYCRDTRILFQIHANEHTAEVHHAVQQYGKRPIELLHSINALGSTTLIAHATLTTPSEVVLLRETDTAVSYNPLASMWKGNAVAPALSYLRQNIRVGLGSDATRNDGFRLLDAAEACQRLVYALPVDDFSCGAGWIWLDAATRGGASAAGLGDITGSLEPGKEADFLILDMSAPEVLPSWDFTWELVRFYDRTHLRCVVIGGVPTVIDGRAIQFDGETFVADSKAYTERRVRTAGVTRIHGPSRHHRPAAIAPKRE